MKEGNNRGGLRWAPIHVGPQAEALTKFRDLNLNQLYKLSINHYLSVSRCHYRIEMFDDVPYMNQGNFNNPRKATMSQLTKREAEIGNGYNHTPLCFLQLFIVSNRDSTSYFANNNARNFIKHHLALPA
jgi:hypothetical protein